MCFSARVSLAAYAVGMLGSAALYHHGYKPEAAFYTCVIQMQLIEFILWMTQPHCNRTNRIATVLGIVVNHLEPIVLYLAILYYGGSLPVWLHAFMAGYVALTIAYTVTVVRLDETACTTVTPRSCPHLWWAWNYSPYHRVYYVSFLVCLVLLSVYGLGRNGKTHAMVVLLSFLVSLVVYGPSHSTGAMWCLVATLGPIVLLTLYKKHG